MAGRRREGFGELAADALHLGLEGLVRDRDPRCSALRHPPLRYSAPGAPGGSTIVSR